MSKTNKKLIGALCSAAVLAAGSAYAFTTDTVSKTVSIFVPDAAAVAAAKPAAWTEANVSIAPGQTVYRIDGTRAGAIRSLTRRNGEPRRVWIGNDEVAADRLVIAEGRVLLVPAIDPDFAMNAVTAQ